MEMRNILSSERDIHVQLGLHVEGMKNSSSLYRCSSEIIQPEI